MDKGILFGNNILDVVIVAWFLAQSYKVISSIITNKKFNIKRLWETGGMPSSHSSTVAALTTSVGISKGMASPLFAICLVFALIVMHDAAGIRRAAGKQAGVLNQLGAYLRNFFEEGYVQEQLKELLGHTPVEVLVGAMLGVAVAFVMKFHLVA